MGRLIINNLKAKTGYYGIGGVPVKSQDKYVIIFPLFNYFEVIEDDNHSFSLRKIYKDKYVLYNKFYMELKPELQNYYDYFAKLIIDVNHVYDYKKNDLLSEANVTDFLNRSEIKELSKMYDCNIDELINEIFDKGIMTYNDYLEDEDSDYTIEECIKDSFTKKIEELNNNIKENITYIYLLQSILYYSFKEIYYVLYNYSKEDTYGKC